MNRADRRAAQAKGDGWGEWERGALPRPDPEQVRATAALAGIPFDRAMAVALDVYEHDEVWTNGLYQANIRRIAASGAWPAMVHLSVKRRDKAPLGVEHFRHLQRIKSELVGPEHEAVELYPAESRLVDSANSWHLWAFADAAHRFPFGFSAGRLVVGKAAGGAVQRPLDAE